MPVVKLKVPGDIAYRELAMRIISFVCKKASTDRLDGAEAERGSIGFSDQLVSAVGEAFNNVAIHGYASTEGNVVVTISFDDRRVRVELADDGATFDPDKVPTPKLDALPESGMGLYIIRSFVDELEYSPGPPNVLTMTKRFEQRNCSNIPEPTSS